MNLIDIQNSLIIDTTYNCNAKCKYCQWGSDKTEGRFNQPDNYIYIAQDILKNLKTQRIVFSGGEPLLRLDFENIISYYKNMNIESITTITNGFLLSEKRLESLIMAGLNGIAFSIDSFDGQIMENIRSYNSLQMEKVLKNFKNSVNLKNKYEIEIGINAVISTGNLYNQEIEKMVQYANDFPIDWIKFQPIFDDGYAGRNANHLLLNSEHSDLVLSTGRNVTEISKPETNPISFWESLSMVLNGRKLKGSSCGLDTRQTIAQKGDIKICSWINYPKHSLGQSPNDEIGNMQSEFINIKSNCKTGTFCYCLQKLNHSWEIE